MSELDIASKLGEMFNQDYQISVDRTAENVGYCDQLIDSFSSQEKPDLDFYLNILQNLRLFFNCEFLFQNKRIDKALSNYQKVRESLSKTQTEFPDFYSKWQYDLDRLMLRIDARIQNLKASTVLEEKDYAQAQILFTEAIKRYTTELELEQGEQDYYHYFDSLRNIYYLTGLLYRTRGISASNWKEMYQALRFFRKARFLGQETSNIDFNETREEIISFRLEKLEKQAEIYFTNGLVHTQQEQYHQAMINYNKSAQLYRSLRKIRESIEYELQEQIQLSSYYEALAKNLVANDDNESAAKNFLLARETLDRVLQKIPGEQLTATFKPQLMYFEAMHLFCQAVVEYDQLKPESIEHFSDAITRLEDAKEQAKEFDNQPLVNSCIEAINKLNSYQEIGGIMFQSEPSDD